MDFHLFLYDFNSLVFDKFLSNFQIFIFILIN